VEPDTPNLFDVINPATEEVVGRISRGSAKDVDRAVKAARLAFPSYSATTREERLELLRRIINLYEGRADELSRAMTAEMGAPITFSREVQTVMALNHFKEMVDVLAVQIRKRHGRHHDPPGADRRLWPDHAVELAAQPGRLEARTGTGGRLHIHAEAQRNRAAQHNPAG
jgi:acyl-CoA reductase-like NAD-dependent aldehyde dehydrogenase